METHEPKPVRQHHVHQRHFDRLVMLSDGVFAIAMTLSAVELRPQALPGQSLAQVWARPLLTYFVSFVIIAGVWARHRRALSHLRRVDTTMSMISLLLLSLVALMPVVIRVLLEGEATAGSPGMLVYSLSMMANYACLFVGWGYAAFLAGLAPDVPRPRAWSWLLQELFVTVIFAALALYTLQLRVAAALVTLLGVGLRIGAMRFERASSRLDAVDGHADRQPADGE